MNTPSPQSDSLPEPQAPRQHSLKRFIAAGAIAVGSIGAGADQIDASPADEAHSAVDELQGGIGDGLSSIDNAIENDGLESARRMTNPESGRNIIPEPVQAPEHISTLLDETAAFVEPSNCSGSLIRDSAGQLIGGTTARHCLAENGAITTFEGPNGPSVYSFEVGGDVGFFTGNDTNNMSEVGYASHIILGSDKNDTAIFVMEGSDPQAVLDAIPERVQMQVGDPAWFKGYPANVKGGPTTPEAEAIEGLMTFVGYEEESRVGGQRLENVAVFAMKENVDNEGCDPGTSGTKAFNSEGHDLGTLAAMSDMRDRSNSNAQQSRDLNQARYNIANIDDIDMLCFFSQPLDPTEARVYEIVTPEPIIL